MRGNPVGGSLTRSGNHRGPTAAPLPENVENTHHSLQGFSCWTRLLPACQYCFFSFLFFFFFFLHFPFVHIEYTHANVRFKVLTAVLTKKSFGIWRRIGSQKACTVMYFKTSYTQKLPYSHEHRIDITHDQYKRRISVVWQKTSKLFHYHHTHIFWKPLV